MSRSWLTPLLLCAACHGPAQDGTAPEQESTPAETKDSVTDLGPVKATVSVSPTEPKLGDVITLKLRVEAKPGVEVELPRFGEALGRFSVVDFVPREERQADGSLIASQRYRLQAPMSGHQRIPSLRVEFTDRREESPDAGTPEVKELLTEEIPLQIASVLPEGALAGELRGERGSLPVNVGPGPLGTSGLIAALAVLAVLAFFVLKRFRGYRERQVRISAFDVAMTRLGQLEARGLPEGEDADDWYVELSAIVRKYLEDRYGLRAPELTTEEFLREARRSGELEERHRALLLGFLEGCDRVKFAAHQPDSEESRSALESARSFLLETKLEAEPSAPALAEAA